MPWQQFKAGRCVTKSRRRWIPASRKNAVSLPLLAVSARAAFLSRERAGEIFRSPLPTDPRAQLSPAGTSTPKPCLEGRSFAVPLPAPRLSFGQRPQCPAAGLLAGRTWGGKNLQSKFLFLPGIRAVPAEGWHWAAFLCTVARGPAESCFQAAALIAVCSQGQERRFGHKPLKKKKKTVLVSEAVFTYWKISILP